MIKCCCYFWKSILNDVKNENKNGWYEYSDFFVNVLIALDPCDSNNGAIEISNSQKEPFDRLFENTKKNGTPDLLPEIEKKLKFKIINLDAGDAVVFSNTCPHRSRKNRSNLRVIVNIKYRKILRKIQI